MTKREGVVLMTSIDTIVAKLGYLQDSNKRIENNLENLRNDVRRNNDFCIIQDEKNKEFDNYKNQNETWKAGLIKILISLFSVMFTIVLGAAWRIYSGG